MEFTTVSCLSVVEAVVRLVRLKAKAQGVRLLAEVMANSVRCDAQLVQEAVLNLVENALRYSGSECIRIRVTVAAGKVTFAVTDYGIGIPAEHLPRLFERFYRVDKARSRSLGGTGLGLAIVKHIVHLHGGHVAVESQPGVKTVFSFSLPRACSVT